MVYLDNAATTYCDFGPDYSVWGNPNTFTKIGREALDAFNHATRDIKKMLKVDSGHIIYGYNATNLFNILFGEMKDTTSLFMYPYEHDAVYKHKQASPPVNVKYQAYCQMLVNNITGDIFDVKQNSSFVRKSGGFVIMDCTAAIEHWELPSDIDKWCDALVVSAHKFHGPKGAGFMWLSDRLYDTFGFRHVTIGTPDVPSIIAMSQAFTSAVNGTSDNVFHCNRLLSHLKDYLDRNDIQYEVYQHNQFKSSAINCIYLPEMNGDALSNYLSTNGVYVSPAHSACAEANDYRVTTALGMDEAKARQSIRVSFSYKNRTDDVKALADLIAKFKENFC